MSSSFSREARDDELSVMEHFTKYLSSCKSYDYSYFKDKRLILSTSLYTSEHVYVRDIIKYIY